MPKTKAQEGEVVNMKKETVTVKKVDPRMLILTFVLVLLFLCGLCAFCGSLPFLLN